MAPLGHYELKICDTTVNILHSYMLTLLRMSCHHQSYAYECQIKTSKVLLLFDVIWHASLKFSDSCPLTLFDSDWIPFQNYRKESMAWMPLWATCTLRTRWCRSVLNPLRAKFLRENINIYLHFMSFLHTNKTQVVEISPRVRQGPAYST